MLGCHTIKHWSSTQTSVALSSGEAEFAGVIRGAGQGLGYQALLKDLGIDAPLRVWTDSSAAIGICSRQGLGKLRHLDTHTLWIQQAVRLGRVDLRKVDGEVNPADLLTKHSLSRERLEALVKLHGCEYIGGRADSAPQAREGASSKTTMASATSSSGVVGAVDGHERQPIMPHNSLSQHELDRDYPSIVPPEDDRLDDIVNDSDDKVFQAGLREAEKIRQTMRVQGRRRRPLKSNATHGTLSLCVEANTTTTTTARSLQPSESQVKHACAERAGTSFGNDVAPLRECNALRVRRLVSAGGVWQRQARRTARERTTTTTTTYNNDHNHDTTTDASGSTRAASASASTQTASPSTRPLRTTTEETGPVEESAGALCRFPRGQRWSADDRLQGSNTGDDNFGINFGFSVEATTSSSLCRRRSVWQKSLPDASTTSTTTTGSDQLIGQRHGIDVGKCDGRFDGVKMRPYRHTLSCRRSECYFSMHVPLCSSARFCET